MNAQLAIAPITDAWDKFRGTAHLGHIANGQDYEEATRVADELRWARWMKRTRAIRCS